MLIQLRIAACVMLALTGSAGGWAQAASVAVQRTRIVENETITGIVAQVAWGAVEDVGVTFPGGGSFSSARIYSMLLSVDGQQRTGFTAWFAAVNRVAGYALDRDPHGETAARRNDASTANNSSVELAYGLHVRGYDIRTTSTYKDGYIAKTIATGWTETIVIPVPRGLRWLFGEKIVRRVPIRVQFAISARQGATNVALKGVAMGTADTSAFCFDGTANKRAREALDSGLRTALAKVERFGVKAYQAGEFSDVIDELRPLIREALQFRFRNIGRR